MRYGLRDLPDGAGLQDMYAATRADGFGPEVKRRIMIGTYVLSAGFFRAYFTQAQKVRAPDLLFLGRTALTALAVLVIGYWFFHRHSGQFSEVV